MTVNEAFLNCISASLRGGSCNLTLAPDDWRPLLQLAGEQKLLPMVYEAVRGTPAFAAAPEEVRTAARLQTMQEAVAQALPAVMPNIRESVAIMTSTRPYMAISLKPAPAFIRFTSWAMINGMIHSITTSRDTIKGAFRDACLYSRMHFDKTFSIVGKILLSVNMHANNKNRTSATRTS